MLFLGIKLKNPFHLSDDSPCRFRLSILEIFYNDTGTIPTKPSFAYLSGYEVPNGHTVCESQDVRARSDRLQNFQCLGCLVCSSRIYSDSLFYRHFHYLSLNRKGRWGTTDNFTTSFLLFPLFSSALWDLANSRPVHSLMLSSKLFLCLPCLFPPFTVPCKMVLALFGPCQTGQAELG